MSTRVMTAAFKDGREARQIGIDIGERVDDRMPHAGLRCQMDDLGKTMLPEQSRDCRAIGEVHSDETKWLEFGKFRKPRLFQCGIVVSIHVVEPDNIPPVL